MRSTGRTPPERRLSLPTRTPARGGLGIIVTWLVPALVWGCHGAPSAPKPSPAACIPEARVAIHATSPEPAPLIHAPPAKADSGVPTPAATLARESPSPEHPLLAKALGFSGYHICAIRLDGQLVCAEDGEFSVVPGVTNVVAFGENQDRHCGVRSDGTLVCDTGTDWKHARANSACVILSDKHVACEWSSRGPLRIVKGIERAVELRYPCARSEDGTVACWGQNGVGQLGDGTHRSRRDAAPVKGLGPATHLFEWDGANCALLRTGAPRCWGRVLWPRPETRHVTEFLQPKDGHVAVPVPLPGNPSGFKAYYGVECTLTFGGRVRCGTLELTNASALVRDSKWACALASDQNVRCGYVEDEHYVAPLPPETGPVYREEE